MRNPFVRRPRHTVVTTKPEEYGFSADYQDMSCMEHDRHLIVVKARLKTYEEQLANQQRLMANALRVAFNCGNMLGKVLETNTVLAPVLAADGQSVVIDFDSVTITVLPFQEEVHVTIRGDVEVNVFAAPNGVLSADNQNRLIGIFARSKRENPALDSSLSLAGVIEDTVA